MRTENVVHIGDELAGLFARLFKAVRVRLAHFDLTIDELHEGLHHCLAKQPRFAAEVTEHQGFGNLSRVSNLAGRRAGVAPAVEHFLRGGNQQTARLAPRPAIARGGFA